MRRIGKAPDSSCGMSSADIEVRRSSRNRIQDRFHLCDFNIHEFNVRRQSRGRHLCGIHFVSDIGLDAAQSGLNIVLVCVDVISHQFELRATIGDDLVGYRDGLGMKSEISLDSIQSVVDILKSLLDVCGILGTKRRLRRPRVGRVVARSLTSSRATTLKATMTSCRHPSWKRGPTVARCCARPIALNEINESMNIPSLH